MKKKKIVGRFLLPAIVLSLVLTLPAAGSFIWTDLENFEGYADTQQMNNEAPLYTWATDGGAVSYTLATDTANSGSQSVYCKLSPAGWGTWNVFGLRYYEGNGINLSSYEVLSMSLKGSSTHSGNNNVNDIIFQVADRFGNLLIDQVLDIDWATSDDWNTVQVEIDDRWNWGDVSWIGLRVQRNQYHNPDFWLDDFKVGIVPEPATLALLGFGAAIAGLRRKRVK